MLDKLITYENVDYYIILPLCDLDNKVSETWKKENVHPWKIFQKPGMMCEFLGFNFGVNI